VLADDVAARVGRARWLLPDAVAGGAYAAGACSVLARHLTPSVVTGAAVALVAVAVAVARVRPVLAGAAATSVLWLAALVDGLAWLGAPPLAYAAFRAAERSSARVAAAALLVGVTGPIAAALPSFRHAGGVVPFELLLLTSWAAGTTVRRRREEADQRLRQAARDADVAVERAQRELVSERLRIARELHDVVAHSISAITVQAGYGRLAVEREPTKAAAALGAIETTGRQTLEELRQLLGVLRTPSSLEPAPVLADLPALLRDVGGPELATELTVVHQPRPLPSGLELAAYRIVQEALTNVVRHSQATRAAVRISYEPAGLRIQITDNGGGANERGSGSRAEAGHGLVGMRERAALYGGDLSAGPRFGGGFEVTAVLQIPSTATLPA